MIRISLLLWISACFACSKPAPNKESTYFNLTDFFESEIARLEKVQPKAIKTVTIDGKTESIEPDTLNYRAALQIFMDADINKPAWKGRFRVEHHKQTVQYSTTDKDIPVKSVLVTYKNNMPESITIQRSTYAMLAGASQHMTYHINQGFTVVTTQHAFLRDDKVISVELRFNP